MQLGKCCWKHSSASCFVGLFLLVIMMPYAGAQVDVLTQHNDNYRTGANLRETTLTPDNVNQAKFGMLFKRVVDDQLYTQPLVVTSVSDGGRTRDVVGQVWSGPFDAGNAGSESAALDAIVAAAQMNKPQAPKAFQKRPKVRYSSNEDH